MKDGIRKIEVSHFRDFIYDENRCRTHIPDLPRSFSCLTNAAIAIVRRDGCFRCIPETNRRYAARAQETLGLIMDAPGA